MPLNHTLTIIGCKFCTAGVKSNDSQCRRIEIDLGAPVLSLQDVDRLNLTRKAFFEPTLDSRDLAGQPMYLWTI